MYRLLGPPVLMNGFGKSGDFLIQDDLFLAFQIASFGFGKIQRAHQFPE